MANASIITIGGTDYYVKDSEARSDISELNSDISDLNSDISDLNSAFKHIYNATSAVINVYDSVSVGDCLAVRLVTISDRSKDVVLYGIKDDNSAVGIIRLSNNDTNYITVNESYASLRFAIAPYDGSWTGSYKIELFTNLTTILKNDLLAIENNIQTPYHSGSNALNILSSVSIGETIYIDLAACSDYTAKFAVYGIYNNGSEQADNLGIIANTSKHKKFIATRSYDSIRIAISPWDSTWTGTFDVFFMRGINIGIKQEVYNVSSEIMQEYVVTNSSVLNVYYKGLTGDHVFFAMNYISDETIPALQLYGINHNNGQEVASLLIRSIENGKIYNILLAANYEYFRVSLSPYQATWSGEYSFSFLCVDEIRGIGSVYTSLANIQNDISNAQFNNKTAKIFKRVVCCGDSYTAGHIQLNGEPAVGANFEFAWPHFMATATGNEWINCGSSGANVWTWMEREAGLAKAESVGLCQAYNIGLMINDQSGTERGIPIGTPSDIGTENRTYYAGLSKIIRELNAISPTAKIFVDTCPESGENYPLYNEAVRTIVAAYKNIYPVHLLDLQKYEYLYKNPILLSDKINGHYTAIGYEQFAEIFMYILSRYINENISDFQDVFKIPYAT